MCVSPFVRKINTVKPKQLNQLSRQFNIISFNIQGLSSHTYVEIKKLIDNNPQIDIICIQETKFIENYIRTIPGFRTEFKFYSGPITPKKII
jgi:exonuclease III